ncbi:MAG: hypothetical protein PHI38_09765 [Sulfurimonas sp.]|uniref:hypothetical protein n=1 Tax=Sulfurimonas sp. TaxID=2022749 RepID=UPI0026244A54|nr:hypothetical protein [Sulfurimonas sp.]MDD3477142.1 hypothetical protein [Sulfurimonas sp.]
MALDLDKVGSFIIGCILFGLFLWIHLIPFIMSLKTMNYLKNKNKEYTPYIILSIISLIPTFIFLYLMYFGLTCGSGCFSGIFFFMSLIPVLILSIVNQIIKNYVYKIYNKS